MNHAWNTTAQEMFLIFIILFIIEFFAFQEKRLLKHTVDPCSRKGLNIFDSIYYLFLDKRLFSRMFSIFFKKDIKCLFREHPLDIGSSPFSDKYTWA